MCVVCNGNFEDDVGKVDGRWIFCDHATCQRWLHGRCSGLDEHQLEDIFDDVEYLCPKCQCK